MINKPLNKMQELENLGFEFNFTYEDSCLRCKRHSFLPVCSKNRKCKKCIKSTNSFHARRSAERRVERVRRLKQEADVLRIELERAAFELEIIKAANQVYRFEIESKKLQCNNYRMLQKQRWNNFEEYKTKKTKITITWRFFRVCYSINIRYLQ